MKKNVVGANSVRPHENEKTARPPSKTRKLRTAKSAKGKGAIKINFFLISGVIAWLAYYITRESMWSLGTIVVMLMLAAVAGFYFWLWKFYIR